jgi:hypothetical protein
MACERVRMLFRQSGRKLDVALTTDDETSNLLSPLGRCKGVEVVWLFVEAIRSRI